MMQRHSGQEMGSLIVELSTSAMGAKSILPPLDMEAASYDLSGNGPGMTAFTQIGLTGSTAVENTLAVGAWTITVDAFNAAHDLIGGGSTAVSIEAGETAQASVQIVPLSGTGTVTINISWTPGLISVPSVVATLTPAGGGAQSLSFTTGVNSATYSSGKTLSAGYYSLALKLQDNNLAVWGFFEAVRILKDQTTEASFDLTW